MHKNRILAFFLSCSAFFLPFTAHGAETAVVTEGKINVRGKPSFIGEVITQLENGDRVTVLERINLDNPRAGEPTNWAKIKLPENTPVWVFALFIKEGKVSASRLNMRAGPGENYSVLGRIERGHEVQPIRTVVEWMEIEAPTNAYAFIDLTLVRFEGGTNGTPAAPTVATHQPGPEVTNAPPAVVEPRENTLGSTNQAVASVPETNVVATTTQPEEAARQRGPTSVAETSVAIEQPTFAEEKVEPAPVLADSSGPTNAVATAVEPAGPETAALPGITPLPQPESLPPVAEPLPRRSNEPPIKRVVRREGIIRATKSIQAPTWYELVHATTGKTINYLYDSKLDVKLKDYRGQKVMVSGQEAIDPRWPNTPILDLETLDLLP